MSIGITGLVTSAPPAADDARALVAAAEASGKPCVLPADLIAALETEARAVLDGVEPRDTMVERVVHVEARAREVVLVQKRDERGQVELCEVPRDDWRPRATRTPSGWSIEGGWLDEAVPELLTGRTVPQERPRWTAERAEIARAKGEG